MNLRRDGILLGIWFLTDGLPRLAATINGQSPFRIVHPAAAQLEALNHGGKSTKGEPWPKLTLPLPGSLLARNRRKTN